MRCFYLESLSNLINETHFLLGDIVQVSLTSSCEIVEALEDAANDNPCSYSVRISVKISNCNLTPIRAQILLALLSVGGGHLTALGIGDILPPER